MRDILIVLLLGALLFALLWVGTSPGVWYAGEVRGGSVEESFSDLDE